MEALEKWDLGRHPEAVLFKALYLFSRAEGYAVKESWLEDLSASQRELAIDVLRTPVRNQRVETETVNALIDNLKRWLAGETDILV